MTTAKTKAAPKTATPKASTTDAFAFPTPSFDAFGPAFQGMADESLAKGKEAFEKFQSVSEEAKEVLETTFDKARDSVIELNEKTMSVAETNSKAAFEHAKEVMAVKNFADAFELQTAFVKKQMSVFQDQAQAFQEMTANAAQEATQPYQAAFEKSLNAFKPA